MIFVARTVYSETVVFNCETSDTIFTAKQLISQKIGHPVECLKLLLSSQELDNERTIESYSIQGTTLVHIIISE